MRKCPLSLERTPQRRPMLSLVRAYCKALLRIAADLFWVLKNDSLSNTGCFAAKAALGPTTLCRSTQTQGAISRTPLTCVNAVSVAPKRVGPNKHTSATVSSIAHLYTICPFKRSPNAPYIALIALVPCKVLSLTAHRARNPLDAFQREHLSERRFGTGETRPKSRHWLSVAATVRKRIACARRRLLCTCELVPTSASLRRWRVYVSVALPFELVLKVLYARPMLPIARTSVLALTHKPTLPAKARRRVLGKKRVLVERFHLLQQCARSGLLSTSDGLTKARHRTHPHGLALTSASLAPLHAYVPVACHSNTSSSRFMTFPNLRITYCARKNPMACFAAKGCQWDALLPLMLCGNPTGQGCPCISNVVPFGEDSRAQASCVSLQRIPMSVRALQETVR